MSVTGALAKADTHAQPRQPMRHNKYVYMQKKVKNEQQNPPPKPPEDDVATAKEYDPLLGKVGEAIQESSAAAESSAQEVRDSRLTCGLLLAFGKNIAGHKGFHGWCDAQKFKFSRMSRSKYMRLADQLCQKGKCKSDLLLPVEYGPDGRPSAFKLAEDKLTRTGAAGVSVTVP